MYNTYPAELVIHFEQQTMLLLRIHTPFRNDILVGMWTRWDLGPIFPAYSNFNTKMDN